MKKMLLFFTFVMLVSCNKKANGDECLKFHTGKFRYLDDNFKGVIIERNDSVQRETKQSANRYFEGRIKWLSDCEYEITLQKSNAPYSDELLNQTVHTTIEEVNGNVATLNYTIKGVAATVKIEKIE